MTGGKHTDIAGIVVAGGRSTRFGEQEKALAAVGGEPMLTHVVSTLGSVSEYVVVNCRADQQAVFAQALADLDVDIRWALDEQVDEGPLRGLETALAAVDTELAIALGCDMPLVETPALEALCKLLGDADAAVPRTEHGPEPLHAVYRVEPTLAGVRATLADDERSLHALLERLTVAYADGGAIPARSVSSIDTEERLQAIRAEKGGPESDSG